jgi:hypothetical protein
VREDDDVIRTWFRRRRQEHGRLALSDIVIGRRKVA